MKLPSHTITLVLVLALLGKLAQGGQPRLIPRELQTDDKTACVDGRVFTVVTNNLEGFNGAVAACAAIADTATEFNSVLAAIETIEQFNLVAALPDVISNAGSQLWIGMQDQTSPNNQKKSPSKFSYIKEGVSLPTEITNLTRGEFPWGSRQPDTPNEECATIFQESLGVIRLNDASCSGTNRAYVCSADCPTNAPTENPTTTPTTSPIPAPTTPLPTKRPTKSPTKSPTRSPTPQPTDVPTRGPTKFPTASPTPKPTDRPTKSPTKFPTSSPTQLPTKNPTKSPTETPTRNPTTSPTRSPTNTNPTISPTTKPTSSPVPAAEVNVGAIVGVTLPLILLCSLAAVVMFKRDDLKERFGFSTKPGTESHETEDAMKTKNQIMYGLPPIVQSGGPVQNPKSDVDIQMAKSTMAPTKTPFNIASQAGGASMLQQLKEKKKDLKSASSPSRPPLSTTTLKRKKKEKEDEEAFEALMANNGKLDGPLSSLSSKPKQKPVDPDEQEFEAILAGNGKIPAKSGSRVKKRVKKKNKKSSSVAIAKPPLSSNTLERKKKEKADEEEFEALMSGGGKLPAVKSSDEEEFEALMANNGKKKNADAPPPMDGARPQSTYLSSIDQNRKSIFRPSSLFLTKAKKEKAMKILEEEEKKKKEKEALKKNFSIDDDI